MQDQKANVSRNILQLIRVLPFHHVNMFLEVFVPKTKAPGSSPEKKKA